MTIQTSKMQSDAAVRKAVRCIANVYDSVESISKLANVTTEFLHCSSCYVYLPEPSDPCSYRCVAATPHKRVDTQVQSDILRGVLAKWIPQSVEPINLRSADEIRDFIAVTIDEEYEEAELPPLHNLLLQPFTIQEGSVGVIVAGDKSTEQGQAFADTDVDVLAAIADVFALVARHATPTTDAATRVDGIRIREAIQEVATKLGGRISLQELLHEVLEATMNRFDSEICSVFLTKSDAPHRIECVAGSGYAQRIVGKAEYEIGYGFTGHIAETKKAYNIRDKSDIQRLMDEGIWKNTYNDIQFAGTDIDVCHNILAVPLLAHDGVLGVIKVENKKVARPSQDGTKEVSVYTPYTNEDLQEFETIANVVSLAIQNARLHQQIENQLKSIAAKAAHRIHNQAANYDGLQWDLKDQCDAAVPDKEQLNALRTRLMKTTESLKRMIDEFKNYGKPLQLAEEIVDLNKIVHDEVWLANKNTDIRIEKDLAENLPPCSVDAGRFAEALKELLQNAKTALANAGRTGKTGMCRVTTRVAAIRDLHSKPRDDRDDGEAIVLTIADNGPGFPEGFPIFEPFHSTDPNSTGLGLATVKELLEAHGGLVNAERSSLGGAEITLVLPVRR